MMAERDTNDRYLAAFLSERLGEEVSGKISGVAKFGVFVRLDDTGADGLVPMRALGAEYFHFDRERGTLMGADSGRLIGLGQRVLVRLAEAAPVTGGLALDLVELEGEVINHREVPSGSRRGRPKGRGGGSKVRKPTRAKAKAEKTKRKVRRRRK
ncbi:MAG: S1 RNA-binding domain-containing protein, partial [Pseudomonadota bacterium]